MAAPSSLYRSSITIDSISRSLGSLSQGLNRSRKTIVSINKNISSSNDVKRKSLSRDSLLFQRKRENVRRKKQRSLLDLSRLNSVFAAPRVAISNTGKSLLGRMMDFAGAIMAGWLVYNLPTISTMANELGARIVRLTQILGEFLPNTGRILAGIGDVIGAYTTNILSLDFTDKSKRVENSMENLSLAFSQMQNSFNEAVALITTPLTEGLDGRPSAPPFGTDYSQGGGQPSGGGGAGRWKPLLDLIASGESTSSGGYDAMYPGRNTRKEGKPVSEMTISQAARYAGDPGDGRNYAVGRYQFTTVKAQAKAAGLNPDKDLFSPANQDKMAVHIIEGKRKGKDWLSGKITDEQFSEYLAGEWGTFKSASGYVLPGNTGSIGFDKIKPVLKQVKSTPAQPSGGKPQPTPARPSTGTIKLIPQTGTGGFIQGGSGSKSETEYATHFHIDLKTPNYTQEGLAKIREVAFQAIKAMQARGSYVTFGNIPGYPKASTNESVLRSQILQDQQIHGARSTPGVDIQEHNSNFKPTFPSQPGSKTTFPFAVGAVYWRGGYGREAEIIGSGGVTVSHGAPGSRESENVVPTKLSSSRVSSTKPETQVASLTPERKRSTIIVIPQEQQPQIIPSSSGASYSQSVAQAPINNNRNIFLTDLAYT